MVRLKMVNIHKTDDIPDHIIEELKVLTTRIMKEIAPIAETTNSNLMLSAINHIAAIMVKIYISEDPEEIKKAALNLATAFLENVKFYTGVDVMEMGKNDNQNGC